MLRPLERDVQDAEQRQEPVRVVRDADGLPVEGKREFLLWCRMLDLAV
jgi:hypothetical protein